MKRLAGLVAALTVLCACAASAATRPWTTDDLLAVKTVSDPQLSPDGRWIVYVVNELNSDKSNYQSDLWLVGIDGGKARRLTSSSANDEFPRWSPDGKAIAFISERPRPGKEAAAGADVEDGRRQVWMIRLDGGEAWLATESTGSVFGFEWFGDGESLAYLAREPKSEERKKREKEKDDAWTPSMKYPWNRLWTLDLPSRKATQLTSGDIHVSAFSVAPDGKRLAFAAQPTPYFSDRAKSDLYVVSSKGGKWTPLVARLGSEEDPRWSPDGKWIAFVSQDERDDEWYTNNYLCVVPASGGATRNLSADLDERLNQITNSAVEWTPDSRALIFQAYRGVGCHLYRVPVQGGVIEPLTHGDAMNTVPSLDRSGTRAVFLREDSEHAREVYRMRLPRGDAERITETNPQLADLAVYKKERITWKGADGMDMEGLLILPRRAPNQRVPLLLNVHGGPASIHSNTCTAASVVYPWTLFAQKGYAIFLPNPRGSGGYGEKFRSLNVKDWGGKDYEDIMAGVDALIERGIADPHRMAVSGWSYGGFMTSIIVTKTDRFRVAVAGGSVTDNASMALLCDLPDFVRSYFGGWPWEGPQEYVKNSAVYHAHRIHTPTYLIHGEKDDRSPTSQSWELYNALKHVGVPTDLLLLPRQPHGPREPKLIRAVHEWHLDWINRYTLSPAPTVKLTPRDSGAGKTTTSAVR